MPNADFFSKFGLFVQKNFVSPEQCAALRAEMAASKVRKKATVQEHGTTHLDQTQRSTQTVQVSDAQRADVAARLEAIMPRIAAHFNTPLARCQAPQFLTYREGDFFIAHKDNDGAGHVDQTVTERKVSAVLFLNGTSAEPMPDAFGGGSLVLYGLTEGWEKMGMPLEPEPGLLLGFPSDMLHEVNPVTHGERFSVVAWYF